MAERSDGGRTINLVKRSVNLIAFHSGTFRPNNLNRCVENVILERFKLGRPSNKIGTHACKPVWVDANSVGVCGFKCKFRYPVRAAISGCKRGEQYCKVKVQCDVLALTPERDRLFAYNVLFHEGTSQMHIAPSDARRLNVCRAPTLVRLIACHFRCRAFVCRFLRHRLRRHINSPTLCRLHDVFPR